MTNPWLPGLCSVTFRASGIDEVVALAAEAGLRAIEWGADVHVTPGDLDAAAHARRVSMAAGIEYLSYGSYLLTATSPSTSEVDAVLATAVALGANNVRVWTPMGVSNESSRRDEVIEAVRHISAAAATRDITIGLEYHGGTLTATAASTIALLTEADAPNLYTYWQPSYWIADRIIADDVNDVRSLSPRLAHLHVYEWDTACDRHPLEAGAERWNAVLASIQRATTEWSGLRAAFLEFVANDDPAMFQRDAATLLAWLAAVA